MDENVRIVSKLGPTIVHQVVVEVVVNGTSPQTNACNHANNSQKLMTEIGAEIDAAAASEISFSLYFSVDHLRF